MGVHIYPVIEAKDLIYAFRYNWLSHLIEVSHGVLLRPEPFLQKAYKQQRPFKMYLNREFGIPLELLNQLKIMLDHGINSPIFVKVFGVKKTPKNLVKVYSVLGVDFGVAYDIPVRLYLSFMKQKKKDLIKLADPAVRHILRKLAENSGNEAYLRELSRIAVDEGIKRLKEMITISQTLQYKNLVPVVQGLFKEDIEYSVQESIKMMSEVSTEFLIAIGTGGRMLSRQDIENIKFAIQAIEKYASKYSVSAKVHLLGWSSPNNLRDLSIMKKLYSADSLTVRRRAVEGKIYLLENGQLRLVKVNELKHYQCNCPVCSNPVLRHYVLDPSGARRNDVRMAHNLYVLKYYLNHFT